jgi:hypothetical protein
MYNIVEFDALLHYLMRLSFICGQFHFDARMTHAGISGAQGS